MAFEFVYQEFIWTSAKSMWHDNLVKISIGLEENGYQFVMGNFIEITVKFAKMV